jgi:hypothetical protein
MRKGDAWSFGDIECKVVVVRSGTGRHRQAHVEDVGNKGDNTVYRHHEQEPDDVC